LLLLLISIAFREFEQSKFSVFWSWLRVLMLCEFMFRLIFKPELYFDWSFIFEPKQFSSGFSVISFKPPPIFEINGVPVEWLFRMFSDFGRFKVFWFSLKGRKLWPFFVWNASWFYENLKTSDFHHLQYQLIFLHDEDRYPLNEDKLF